MAPARRSSVSAADQPSAAAEMQLELLPPRMAEVAGGRIVASVLPAYDVGGDSLDYSVESGVLHVSLTDAMGHGLQSSLLDTLAV